MSMRKSVWMATNATATIEELSGFRIVPSAIARSIRQSTGRSGCRSVLSEAPSSIGLNRKELLQLAYRLADQGRPVPYLLSVHPALERDPEHAHAGLGHQAGGGIPHA